MLSASRVPLSTIAAGVLLLVSLLGLAWTAVGANGVRRDRDAHVIWAESACANVGAAYVPLDAKTGQPGPRKTWGAACLTKIRDLVAHAAGVAVATVEVVQDHQQTVAAKGADDRGAARRDDQRRQRASATVEKLDAAIEGDRVDGVYLRALGALAGLPDAPAGGAVAAGGSGDPIGDRLEGSAAGGPPDLRQAAGELQRPGLGGDPGGGARPAA